MPTIGKRKKSKNPNKIEYHKTRLQSLPTRGFKRVASSVLGEKGAYNISNKDKLAKYFNKDGSLKQSALRSNRQRGIFKSELAKAKEEIREQQRERKEQREKEQAEKREKRERAKAEKDQKESERLKSELEKALEEIERLKKEKEELERKAKEEKEEQAKTEKEKRREKAKKDKEKREKQKETYKENHEDEDISDYEDFIDILDTVYDEVDLYFYDSDQVMRMMDDESLTYQDIVDFLVKLNKDKEKELTTVEKKLLKDENVRKLGTEDRANMHKEVAQAMYLSSKSNLKPEEWYTLKTTNYLDYVDKITKLLNEDELDEFTNDIR